MITPSNTGEMAHAEITAFSAQLASEHYENFPVASIVLPRKLRQPISLIYTFARQADDFADEGNHTPEQRLAMLQSYREQLDAIAHNKPLQSPLFQALQAMIAQHDLPLQPFYDLLDAFSQDVTKTRYANFAEVLDYCRHSANPIGALLLHLFSKASPENLAYSDNICSALQLINFYQDIVIDYDQAEPRQRVYLCQDEMAQFGVTETQIAAREFNQYWAQLMQFNLARAHAMLRAGKPLGHILPGRMGLEMRLIIHSGERIVQKLQALQGNVFAHRPTLSALDWPPIILKSLL